MEVLTEVLDTLVGQGVVQVLLKREGKKEKQTEARQQGELDTKMRM